MHMLRLFKNQVLLVTVMLDRIFSRFIIFNKALVISRKGKYSGKYKIEYERVTIILCFQKEFVSFPSLNNYLKAQFIEGWTQRSIVTFMYLYSSEQDGILERPRYILSLWLHVSREIYSLLRQEIMNTLPPLQSYININFFF